MKRAPKGTPAETPGVSPSPDLLSFQLSFQRLTLRPQGVVAAVGHVSRCLATNTVGPRVGRRQGSDGVEKAKSWAIIRPVRRLVSIPLVLVLATLVHVDWHFARPTHHRLSLGWSSHWLFCAVIFGCAGWYVARRWPGDRWRRAIWNVALALLLAQAVEPLLEAAYYDHQLAYDVDPERWTAFWQCVGAGLLGLLVPLVISHPKAGRA